MRKDNDVDSTFRKNMIALFYFMTNGVESEQEEKDTKKKINSFLNRVAEERGGRRPWPARH